MSRMTSLALMPWLYSGRKLPYTIDTGDETLEWWRRELYRVVTVRAVTVKTGFAASAKIMLPHAFTEAASLTVDGNTIYAVRWLCVPQQGSVDAVLLPPDTPSGLCHMCAVKVDGEGPGMYRIFDADRLLIYVGSSVRVNERVMHHRRRAEWKGRIADVTITRFPTITQARAAEYQAIRTERPALNVMHATDAA